ncbi:MAG: decaprenylphospho-beta-D-erythro-pentofuranosid-2-ulose 2-reductase [Actinomycetota bacterium]|nr:decaprenylphospho-beta-D-erythro-pentofuranosid-2-ulose 2-reductase [Actinomycetota bacterium]
MENAFAEPQTIVLLGGTSEIGRAIATKLVSATTTKVVLACRRPGEANPAAFERNGLTVDVVSFDAADTASHEPFVASVAERHGDLDVVVLAFGVLGDQAVYEDDPQAAADAVHVNYTGAVSVSLAAAKQLRRQGHGRLVVLSSVAGERVRKANFVYGSSKAGLDGFAQGLADSLHGSGASVLVVRPGFVHSKMTEGHEKAPFATTPAKVAEDTVRALRSGRHTVWSPGILRIVFSVLRHVPRGLFRRLPLG